MLVKKNLKKNTRVGLQIKNNMGSDEIVQCVILHKNKFKKFPPREKLLEREKEREVSVTFSLVTDGLGMLELVGPAGSSRLSQKVDGTKQLNLGSLILLSINISTQPACYCRVGVG